MARWSATHEIKLRKAGGTATKVRVMLTPDGGAPTSVEYRAGGEPIWSWSECDGWRWVGLPAPPGWEVLDVKRFARRRPTRKQKR